MTERRTTRTMYVHVHVGVHAGFCTYNVSSKLPFWGKVYQRPCIPKSGQNVFFEFKHCWKAALLILLS